MARDEGEKPEEVRNMLREERKRKRHWLSKNPRLSWRPKKRYRFSGYKWLNEVNSAIPVSTDQPGLEAFKLADNILDRGPPETWPRLTIAADRGADGVTALGFCRRHLKLNVDYTPDPSHDVTNGIDCCGTRLAARGVARHPNRRRRLTGSSRHPRVLSR